MPDPYLTIVGNVATAPRESETKHGDPFVTFRLATNNRHYDPRERRYVDGPTSFYTVACWRDWMVGNVMASVKVGDPVIVRGRIQMRSWTTDDDVAQVSPEITCYSLGHDLSKGTATFTRSSPPERAPADPDDTEAAVLVHHIAYAEGADPATGEKLEPDAAVA